MTRRVLLICGILSSLLYVAMTAVVAMRYDGYSSASQTISELSAIGAPTRPLWVWLGHAYALLVAAFGWGIRMSARGSRPLRIAGGSLVACGLVSLAWPLAPMHQRAVLEAGGGSFSDAMHIALSIVTVLLMLIAVGCGAAAFGRRFRLYSVGTIVTLAAFGALTGMDGPRVSANLPTPRLGVWERIDIGVFLLWVVMLAIVLLRQGSAAPGTPGGRSGH